MNPIDLLNTVNQFYDQAFNKLIAITFGLLAFIGVIVPIAVGWLQLRTLRAEKSSLLNELRSDISAEREAIESKINDQVEERMQKFKSEYDSKFEEMAKNIRKSSASAKARAHHLQGKGMLDGKYDDLGMSDFSYAASLYFAAGEESNARRCIVIVIEKCLPDMNSNCFNEHNVDNIGKRLIKTLEENNQNSRYEDDIESLRREMTKASSRAKA
jgi:hypothetical protein